MAKQFKDLTNASRKTIVDLFCKRFGYSDTLQTSQQVIDQIPDPLDPTKTIPTPRFETVFTPNPETKAQFVDRMSQEWVVRKALEQRATEASQAAISTALSDADLT